MKTLKKTHTKIIRLLLQLSSQLFYVSLLGVGLLISIELTQRGYSSSISVLTPVISSGVLLFILERLYPYQRQWIPQLKGWSLDLLHSLLSSSLISSLIQHTILVIVVVWSSSLSEWIGVQLWPDHWPILIQLSLGLCIGEFFTYWVHRSCHQFEWGWRIHVVHHSSSQLHFLAAGRTHPLNTLLIFTAQSSVVLLLGANAQVFHLMAVFTALNGQLQHCNLPISGGILNWIVSTSDHHRRHHNLDPQISHSNFGNNLIIWDRIFATCVTPKIPHTVVGLSQEEIPDHLWVHWITPWIYPSLIKEKRDG